MIIHYHINNDFYKTEIVDYNLDKLVMYYLCKPVHNYQDWLEIFVFLID